MVYIASKGNTCGAGNSGVLQAGPTDRNFPGWEQENPQHPPESPPGLVPTMRVGAATAVLQLLNYENPILYLPRNDLSLYHIDSQLFSAFVLVSCHSDCDSKTGLVRICSSSSSPRRHVLHRFWLICSTSSMSIISIKSKK